MPPGGEAGGVRCDLLRSGRPGFGTGVVIVAEDVTDGHAEDPTLPGDVFYYLVSARNACASVVGADSAGEPRSPDGCAPSTRRRRDRGPRCP